MGEPTVNSWQYSRDIISNKIETYMPLLAFNTLEVTLNLVLEEVPSRRVHCNVEYRTTE